jgi:hypothetical protein
VAHYPSVRRSLDAPVANPDFHRTTRRLARRIAWFVHPDQSLHCSMVIGAVDDIGRHHAAIDVELMNAI